MSTPVTVEKPRKPIYKKWWFWTVSFLLLIILPGIFGPTPEPKEISQDAQKIEEEVSELAPSSEAITTSESTSTVAAAEASTDTALPVVAEEGAVVTQAVTPTPTSPQPTPTPTPAESTAPQVQYYSVTKVVDGDTVAINYNGTEETLRLIGINTPETVDPRKPVECFGTEASNKAKSLLTGREVKVELDPTQGERDKYGRLLAYVTRDDGLFFNQYMVEEGYAYEYTYNTPYKYQSQFKAAQNRAKAEQKGLWSPSTCSGSTESAASAPTTQTQPTSPAPASSGHTYYLSTYHTAKYYYCDTDDGWKGLSEKYLKSYSSEAALLADFPGRTLHEECK